ncbi:alpha/beta fold hydrolase [Colwellia sp. MEBiC06753]
MNILPIGIFLIAMSTTAVFATSTPYTSETELPQRYSNEIKQHWQTGHFSSFKGVDQVDIHYAQFQSPAANQCIVLVPGRSEGYLKYQELAYDIAQQGFDLFIIDHRGQGLSGRMLNNKFKGYVELFDDYSTDLHQFIDTIVRPACHNELYLLAHSMGGAISARYLQRFISPVKAAVLSSPMIAINSGGLPLWLSKLVINTGDTLSQLLANQPWYFVGQDDYKTKAFEDNQLSHSIIRYQIFTKLYQATPELQLGGVTFHWLKEALKANEDIFDDIDKLKTPTLVLQAGSDTVVDNSAQDQFCQQLHQNFSYSCPGGKPIVIKGARHEILFEIDSYRQQGLDQILAWFTQHSQ